MTVSSHQIMMAVCHHMKIHPAEITGKSRDKRIVRARKIIARRMFNNGAQKSQIARRLNRHFSTILHYLNPEARKKKYVLNKEKRHARHQTNAPQGQQHQTHPG